MNALRMLQILGTDFENEFESHTGQSQSESRGMCQEIVHVHHIKAARVLLLPLRFAINFAQKWTKQKKI